MFNKLKVGTRLGILVALLSIIVMAVGYAGMRGMNFSNGKLKTVYEDRTVALGQLAKIGDAMLRIRHRSVQATLGASPTEVETELAHAEKHDAAFKKNMADYLGTVLTAEEKKLSDDFTPAWNVYNDKRAAAMALARSGKQNAAAEAMRGIEKDFDVPLDLLTRLRTLQEDVARQEYQDAVRQYDDTTRLNAGLIGGGVLLGVLLSWVLIRSLLRQLGGEPGYAAQIVGEVANGNLAVDIRVRDGDRSSLLYSMKQMVDKLAQVVAEVTNGAQVLTGASEEVSATAQSLSQAASEQAAGGTVGVIGTNSGTAGTNILSATAALATGSTSSIATAVGSLGGGLNMALAPRINGQYYLGALANFLQNSGDANVLSTPNLMTLDNEEAKIVIGNNVPFVTGSYANTTGSSTVNPFNTVERKDVGLMLRVRPQISENGTVKMAIYQEVSKIDASTLKDTNGPTTSKRSIESNVVVDDGNIIVIGGLLEDSYSQAMRVPRSAWRRPVVPTRCDA
eukprot:gene41672-51637_t